MPTSRTIAPPRSGPSTARRQFGELGVQDFAQEPLVGPKGKRLADNGRLVAALRGLSPGERRVICQPRLSVSLGAWRIRGDADLLRVEREPVGGALRILVTDMKSSAEVRVEHRLQVAFYQAMLAKLLSDSGVTPCYIETAILYRPPAEVPLGTPGAKGTDPVADEKAERESAQALTRLGVRSARMEVVANGDAYRAEVENLVTGANSDALRVATAPFDRLFFSLGLKCDGCLYSEFCMKDAHERADVALIPFLPARDKKALASAGVRTVGQLATLKEFVSPDAPDLAATPETVATVRQLSATTVGPRLDELVLRARGNRASQKMGLRGLSYLPSKGHTTLPFTSPEHNPNLVCVYIDAQHDYLHDRVYLLGALVVAHEDGVPVRRRHIVHLTDGPPDSPEAEAGLFAVWIRETIAAIVTLAASNAADERRAPIHLVFWNDFGQRLLLDALARNMTPMVAAAPALYDFVTQMAAFDSPIATFLDDEIRERKNYPMFCQSLTAISQYLGFAWDETATGGKDWRKLFRERLFDRGGKSVFERVRMGDEDAMGNDSASTEEFYERRSRHSSQIPLEYAYAAWGAVPPPIKPTKTDSFAPYRKATRENLVAFQRRRLDAVAHIAGDFEGNRLTEKSTFSLPDLATFRERANHLAGALREFGVIERHVALAAWKTGRQLPPERRVLLGETLLVRYVESDQEADVASQNRDNKVRKALKDDFIADFRAAKPDAKQVRLTPEQKAECEWSMEGMPFRLRFDLTGVDADLPTILGLLNLKDGDRFVLYPRWSTDTRLPLEEQTDNTPTPKQMLYGTRVELLRIDVRKNEAGCPTHAFAHVSVCSPGGGSPGYLFSAMDRPLEPNALYTLDPDPNDIYGLWQSKVTDALCDLEQSATPNVHPLYSRVAHPATGGETVPWPPAAVTGQEKFLLGLDAFRDAGLLHDFETSKRDYIGGHGDAPLLLVQGPPGTGKSYTTAFSVLARMQGAWASNHPHYRATVSCKTHSATDVLLRGVAEAIEKLESLRAAAPDIWAAYFDDRILTVPLLRIASGRDTGALPDAITVLLKDSMRAKGEGRLADDVAAERYAILGATPGGIYGLVKDGFGPTHLCGNALCDLLILDEASQMSLPEAMMASLTLEQEGRVIIVGDPRQMPPIVQHAWEDEPRRTFAEFRAYESLFTALVALAPPYLRFAESFRLHAVMAKYLRDESLCPRRHRLPLAPHQPDRPARPRQPARRGPIHRRRSRP